MTRSAEEINETYDLPALVCGLTPIEKSGGYYYGPCPFCGGERRFKLKHTPRGWRWLCNDCGGLKRDPRYYHTPIDFLMKWRGMAFRQAVIELDREMGRSSYTSPRSKPMRPETTIPEYHEPPDRWQKRAWRFVEECEKTLWSSRGGAALDYLHSRGLTDETIQRFRLGYHPPDEVDGIYYGKHEPAGWWGLENTTDGSGVWLPVGIALPWIVSGKVLKLKVRKMPWMVQREESKNPGKRAIKYMQIEGSTVSTAIYNADAMLEAENCLIAEGEFDVMVAWQEFGDILPAVTLGSAADYPKSLNLSVWGKFVTPVRKFILALDQDDDGERTRESWREFTKRTVDVPIPSGYKDVTDALIGGVNLREWIMNETRRAGLMSQEKRYLVRWESGSKMPEGLGKFERTDEDGTCYYWYTQEEIRQITNTTAPEPQSEISFTEWLRSLNLDECNPNLIGSSGWKK